MHALEVGEGVAVAELQDTWMLANNWRQVYGNLGGATDDCGGFVVVFISTADGAQASVRGGELQTDTPAAACNFLGSCRCWFGASVDDEPARVRFCTTHADGCLCYACGYTRDREGQRRRSKSKLGDSLQPLI